MLHRIDAAAAVPPEAIEKRAHEKAQNNSPEAKEVVSNDDSDELEQDDSLIMDAEKPWHSTAHYNFAAPLTCPLLLPYSSPDLHIRHVYSHRMLDTGRPTEFPE
jgi:hypothetical protein